MEAQATESRFHEGDRVKRADQSGPLGTVTKVRIERTKATLKTDSGEPPGVSVTVLWDNGTLSHFVPDSLTRI
ncbi:MAG: hypothetical protein IT290_07310 [Deltaproteobacteria bacterium]|nr:hypothetical protein [Deltaproteobacteria bacterium]